jgi:branched-chain amino acid transport system ATP-binding protein
MLRLEGLHVRYGSIAAVRDVSLTVEEGEIVGLIGPNGAGKSTTLAAVAGLVPVAAGTILLDGKPLKGRGPDDIVRRGISLVPEGRRIFATLTVEENLRVGLSARRDRAAARADFERMLELFPVLGRFLHDSAGQLSGGEQQQLAIARSLLTRPRLLLVDEPSLGLAPLVVDLVFETLRDLRENGLTILLVEQNALRTIELANRSYVLRMGEIEELEQHSSLVASIASGELYFGTRADAAGSTAGAA